MNPYTKALRNKRRYGSLLLAFTELYGKENITEEMVFGISETSSILENKGLATAAEYFTQVKDLIVISDVVDDESLPEDYFEVNKHFPIAMNTRDTVGVLLSNEGVCCCVIGYDIKHELYIVKFETVEDAPIDFPSYPKEGPNTVVASAKDLKDMQFSAGIVLMRKNNSREHLTLVKAND